MDIGVPVKKKQQLKLSKNRSLSKPKKSRGDRRVHWDKRRTGLQRTYCPLKVRVFAPKWHLLVTPAVTDDLPKNISLKAAKLNHKVYPTRRVSRLINPPNISDVMSERQHQQPVLRVRAMKLSCKTSSCSEFPEHLAVEGQLNESVALGQVETHQTLADTELERKPDVGGAEEKLKVAEVEQKAELAETRQKVEEKVEVTEMKQKQKVAEMEQKAEVALTEQKAEVAEMEQKAEVAETKQKPEQKVEVTEMKQKQEVAEMEQKAEVALTEQKAEVAEMDQKAKVAETKEKPEVAETEQNAEVTEVKPKSEVVETEQQAEVVETKQKPEVAEMEQKVEVALTEQKAEVAETEQKHLGVADFAHASELPNAYDVTSCLQANDQKHNMTCIEAMWAKEYAESFEPFLPDVEAYLLGHNLQSPKSTGGFLDNQTPTVFCVRNCQRENPSLRIGALRLNHRSGHCSEPMLALGKEVDANRARGRSTDQITNWPRQNSAKPVLPPAEPAPEVLPLSKNQMLMASQVDNDHKFAAEQEHSINSSVFELKTPTTDATLQEQERWYRQLIGSDPASEELRTVKSSSPYCSPRTVFLTPTSSSTYHSHRVPGKYPFSDVSINNTAFPVIRGSKGFRPGPIFHARKPAMYEPHVCQTKKALSQNQNA